MANVGPLAAEIVLPVWGTPANFNWFHILASFLPRHRSPEANQTLHDLWSSPELVHYIYILGGFCPWRNFATCKIHFASKSCVLLYWHCYCMALQQWTSAKLCGVVQGMELRNFCRQRHLYSARRPSGWPSAHILVAFSIANDITILFSWSIAKSIAVLIPSISNNPGDFSGLWHITRPKHFTVIVVLTYHIWLIGWLWVWQILWCTICVIYCCLSPTAYVFFVLFNQSLRCVWLI